ncbi:YbaB/EbfC family nucleoid-associated protein [Mycoplasmopsis glycophila]|uniref:Nucleoid-associated protein NCTC10194_00010 n=1 Tax=Mycoplasmopsis glycophila TaxID=171285 RepID=A0A449AU51_9BACT|nr:YbaB/EbfC family nucleoid-associated protein [Mycoplasmopsis glycophila]VEU70016.1 UPF0133 protein MALL_0399 [Mycoplasmopsis glycophila]
MNPEMIKRLKRMQDEMEKKQKEIEAKEFVVEKQGIKVIMLGNFLVKQIIVDEALVDPEDKDILEDLIVIAINEGIDLIKEEQAKAMPQMPSGFGF